VLTFNHKTNDAIESKIDHIFKKKLCAVDGENKKISPRTTLSVLKMLFFVENIQNCLITGSVSPY